MPKKSLQYFTTFFTSTEGIAKIWKKLNSHNGVLSYLQNSPANPANLAVHLRAWVGNLKQRVPITSKSSNFKGETQHYVVKLPKSAGASQYCPKIQWVPGTLGARSNSSPAYLTFLCLPIKAIMGIEFLAYFWNPLIK